MKRRFVYKRDYSFAYNGNINFVLKILTNAALSEGRHSILVPCFFFFSLPKRLPAAALQGWNSFGEVVGKRMKSALSWEMEHGIRERMHFLTGIPAGNAVLWSLPKVQPRRASLLARRTRREKRNRLESCKDNIHQSMRRFRLRLFVSFFFFFFCSPSTGWRIEQDVLGESRPEMIRLKYSLKLQFSAEFMYPVLEERFMERIEGGGTNIA